MKSSSRFLDIISHLLQEIMNLFLDLIQRAFLQEQKGFVVSLKVSKLVLLTASYLDLNFYLFIAICESPNL